MMRPTIMLMISSISTSAVITRVHVVAVPHDGDAVRDLLQLLQAMGNIGHARHRGREGRG